MPVAYYSQYHRWVIIVEPGLFFSFICGGAQDSTNAGLAGVVGGVKKEKAQTGKWEKRKWEKKERRGWKTR